MFIETLDSLESIGCRNEASAWLAAEGLDVFEHPVCLNSESRGVRARYEAGGSTKDVQTHLLQRNDWLVKHDRDVTPSTSGTGRNRARLGIYHFEEPLEDSDES